MALWNTVKDFMDHLVQNEDDAKDLEEEELRLAAAALLVRAMVIDGEIDKREREAVKRVLEQRFGLDAGQTKQLVAEAEEREHEAVDLYSFTSVVTSKLDNKGRQKIVEMLWEIVMADGEVHEFESNLIWRVAELLGVSTRDRIRLRKKVEQDQMKSVWSDG